MTALSWLYHHMDRHARGGLGDVLVLQGTSMLVVLGVVVFHLCRLLVAALVVWVVYAFIGRRGYLAVAVIVGGFFVVGELVAQLGRLARRNSDG